MHSNTNENKQGNEPNGEKDSGKTDHDVIGETVPQLSGALWLKDHWPNVRQLDHDWTMERYDYPSFVRDYIRNHWTKVSDKNGGTYAEPNWWREKRKGKNKCLK